MNNRPTPETDAACWREGFGVNSECVHAEFARKLERERDEARNKMADALQEVDLRILCVDRMNQECYELRKELEEYRSIAENIGAKKAVSEKEQAIRERDEAREDLEFRRELYKVQGKYLDDARRERDEARRWAQQMSESNQVIMADVRFYRSAWEQLNGAKK